MQSLPTLHRLPPSALASMLLSETKLPIAIIDVRDADHIGGHIITSTHIPSTSLDYRIPELVRTLRTKKTVIFHCSLSQQRGPSAALLYLRERDRMSKTTISIGEGEGEKKGMGKGNEEEEEEEKRGAGEEQGKGKGKGDREKEKEKEKEEDEVEQKVYVLDGGFVRWQQLYGPNPRLTEAYIPDIWND